MDQPSGADAQHHELQEQRRENRRRVRALGLDPYGGRTEGVIRLDEARSRYDETADAAFKEHGKEDGFVDSRPVVCVAGRVVLHRDNGRLVWMNLRDAAGDLQVAVSKRDCAGEGFALAKIIDLGDVVVASGPLVKTKTGEVTVWASRLDPASKCLVPPPEKWAGLADVERRYRQRYIDLWANPGTAAVFAHRSRIISRIRSFLDERGFLEVDTPVLQPRPGGAAAKPFVTHMNALDIDLYLRIAPELYLKRLLVGGFAAVYEISRNFRNEGVDRSHNPEFTMVEMYQAFGDYGAMMDLTESLIRELAGLVAGPGAEAGLVLTFSDHAIDYGSPFERVTYTQLFERALGFGPGDAVRVLEEARRRGIEAQGMDDVLVAHKLFEEVAEAAIDPSRPTFVIDWPAALCPLTRAKRESPEIAERFELFIGGMEIANAYTELNDPDVQERKFREQLGGAATDEATFRTFDADFIEALRVGMPPAGGCGIGIDRLVMLLTGQRSIRDVILFPFMRPKD